ncbi:MAG TPA: efflux RND transporter periplasmic adaptor subunit [Bacteroidetes bacterium]|nr:efflux RND transporter periplasmic adaptor subunit [Bacteroidota bacterium]
MSKPKTIIITAILFFFGIVIGGILTAFVIKPGKEAAQTSYIHSESEQTKPKSERKILYWQAPMNPTEIYDKPGKSKMGMDLVPVYEDQTGSGSTVIIDPATVQNMGVRTEKAKRKNFVHSIRTVGKVVYDEKRLFTVTTKISGWIEKLNINYTGQEVKKGAPLLEIYSPELVTTQEEYKLALNTYELVSRSSFKSVKDGAESLLASTRKRLLYWDIPRGEIEQLEKTGIVRKTIQLESPTDGVVIHKNAVEGMHVKEGQNLYQIADLSKVWVNVSVYDNDIPWVTVGQQAEMELSYLPGEIFHGRVTYIYPYLNAKARDLQVRLEFNNPDLKLKPEMYTNVKLHSAVIPDALVIPSEAVIRSGTRNLVFVTREQGKFEPREIRLGVEGGHGEVEVLNGLLEGEEIVTSAQFMLDSESRLQEAIQKMLEEKKKDKQQVVQRKNAEQSKMKMGDDK